MLDRFNTLATEAAEEALLACCAAPAWASRVAAPAVSHRGDLVVAGVSAFDELGWADLRQALARMRASGTGPPRRRRGRLVRREQAGVQGSGRADEVNEAYERRFGHLFLIFASGKSADEILVAARGRMRNDEDTERTVVRGELRKIVELRLERLAEAHERSGAERRGREQDAQRSGAERRAANRMHSVRSGAEGPRTGCTASARAGAAAKRRRRHERSGAERRGREQVAQLRLGPAPQRSEATA